MPRDDAFLQAVIENPDDDAPRLIYADYLEERGDADRSEFIRAQCELARLPSASVRRVKLEARADELLSHHKVEWAGAIAKLVSDWTFRRGFVDAVQIGGVPVVRREQDVWRGFLEHGQDIFHAAPVRHADLLCFESVNQLAICPHIDRFQSLGLHFGFCGSRDDDFRALFSCVNLLRRLTELSFVEYEISLAAMRPVLASPHLGLRELSLHSCHVDAVALVRLLAETRQKADLESLRLVHCGLGDAGARVLRNSEAFRNLTSLTLYDCHLGPDGAREIARSRFLARFEELCLADNPIGDAGAMALAESPYIGGVRELYLAGCGIDDEGARALARSTHLHQLKWLNLSQNRMSMHGKHVLRTCFGDRVSFK